MGSDHFTALDVLLLSMFCLLVWVLNLLAARRNDREGKLIYYIHPMGGRKFYWRRARAEKERDESFSA